MRKRGKKWQKRHFFDQSPAEEHIAAFNKTSPMSRANIILN